MVARLVRQHAAVERPSAPPWVLVVVFLPAAPAHSHGAEHELAEATVLERLPQPHDRHVEPVLLDDEEARTVAVARADHGIRVVQRQGHRLLHHQVLAVRGKRDHVLRVAAALGEHDDHVRLLARDHFVHVRVGVDAAGRGDRVRLRADDVADRGQFGPVDLLRAEQFGVTLGDATAAD